MADAALLRKLNVKPNTGIQLLGVPDTLRESLSIDEAETSATLLFVYSLADIERELPTVVSAVPASQLIWIAFPKKTSGIKTDLSRDTCGEMITSHGFTTVTLISLNDQWSAFRIKPSGSIIKSTRRDPYEPRPNLIVPPLLADRLAKSPEASATFDRLSYSCKKEYIVWIEDAKRPETKLKRLDGTIEKLTAGL